MQQQENSKAPQTNGVADGDWMLIHSDTFISNRDRILLQSTAFMMDRDLSAIKKDIPANRLFN